jgi:hypothetical protein
MIESATLEGFNSVSFIPRLKSVGVNATLAIDPLRTLQELSKHSADLEQSTQVKTLKTLIVRF